MRTGACIEVTSRLKVRFGLATETSLMVLPGAMRPSMLGTAEFQSR
jgi:hypothetical protein